MAAPVVLFDQVWKKFRVGERHDSLRDLVPSLVKGLVRRTTTELGTSEFWAVEDVSFAVEPGQALGIIGPNGAGKSTTLKLLTRIMRPTRGHCRVIGRTGALIEVAAGFHPDLTGRENVFLQGAIMGMTRGEVTARFDDIVDFAGVGEFIDTQVKRYSSGMNARLGFSIAAHLSPDVLIIDEVLSVGDVAFQERCVERMHAYKHQGVAIVFVSHNLQAVTALCDAVLYLNRSTRSYGSPSEVIDGYVRDAFTSSAESSGDVLRIASAKLTDGAGASVTAPVRPGTHLNLQVTYEVLEATDDLTFALIVHRSTDQLTVYDRRFRQSELGPRLAAGTRFVIDFEVDANLARGPYFFNVHVVHNPTQRLLARLRPAAHLTVDEMLTSGGVADLRATATVREGVPLSA